LHSISSLSSMGVSALFLFLLLLPLPSLPQQILPLSSFSSPSCLSRPPSCLLNCPYGFIPSSDGISCLCLCRSHPCQAMQCNSPDVCLLSDGVARCISSRSDVNSTESQHKSALIPTGITPIRPILNSREIPSFLQPVFNASVKALAPSFPISGDRPGNCPSASIDCSSKDLKTCQHDGECPQTYKCCPSRCGDKRLCLPPSRTTTCVHFASALIRIPNQSIGKIWIPRCDSNGYFEVIQCDSSSCWCAHSDSGFSLPGKRQSISLQPGPDPCNARPSVCLTRCTSSCSFGHSMDFSGCPLPNCECIDPCDGIKCPNEGDSCQLVEPDCAEPPCRPVPRCLLSPCPSGSPMTLPNGVTALCTQSEQCSSNHFCHLIGYNGLGFCCSRPLSASFSSLVKTGICPARRPTARQICRKQCSLDTECINGKCCFDGCAMRCITSEFSPNAHNQHRPAEIVRHNKKVVTSSTSSCPPSSLSLSSLSSSSCISHCSSHSDCSGLRLCCLHGCEKKCVYPAATTPCLHDAITAEVLSLKITRKCEADGLYSLHQCDENGCFCVEESTGEEKSGTRTIFGEEPKCDSSLRPSCHPLTCSLSCSTGFELDKNGCKTCKCRDACKVLKCPRGMLCTLFPVDCFSTSENDSSFCPPQPRCVPNFCPIGEPLLTASDTPKTCTESHECEPLHFCHNIGLSSGGVCCSLPFPLIHSGQCPSLPPILPSPNRCAIRCTTDSDCSSAREKCCYDGCGTTCKVVSATSSRISVILDSTTPLPTTTTTSTLPPPSSTTRFYSDKNGGVCPRIQSGKNCVKPPGASPCSSDEDCSGVQKCCPICSSSSRFCLFPSTATACIHLKAAYERSGEMRNNIKCLSNGNFEEIQCDHSSCWCVDQISGLEKEGTRSSRGSMPTCQHRRVCPNSFCPTQLNCSYGRELDESGCPSCLCRSPCKDFPCPDGSFCSPHPVNCLGAICPSIPRCLLNPCPIGIPSINSRSLRPIDCSSNSDCNQSSIPSYCRVFKSSGIGHCCPTPEPPPHSGSCPQLESEDSSLSSLFLSLPMTTCDRQCQFDDQCEGGEKCCEMGCSLMCLPAVAREIESASSNISPLSSSSSFSKIGICPSSIRISSSKCTVDCDSDSDCIGFHKCCQQGCSRKCIPPSITSLCLHKLLSYEDEANRFMFRSPTFTTSNPFVKAVGTPGLRAPPPPIQCSPDGSFRIHQCDLRLNKCWCVDSSTGKEMIGTRSSSLGPLPNCEVGRICSISCSDSSCPHGLLLDSNGCPRDAKCECLSPSQSHSCLIEDEICVLKKIECLDEGNCHPIPICISSPCSSSFTAEIDRSTGGTKQCEEDGDCSGRCLNVTLSEREENKQMRGVCCISGTDSSLAIRPSSSNQSPVSSSFSPLSPLSPIIARPFCPSHGILTSSGADCSSTCSTDLDCEGSLRCCEVNSCARRCVQPVRTTNCLNIRKSFDSLKRLGATIGLTTPQCDLITGQFSTVQCSPSHCWCVDTLTGGESPGTRVRGLANGVICAVPRQCSSSCSPLSCPHSSLLLDSSGCPLSHCKCDDPCRSIICPDSKICVLRNSSCSQQICIPVPSCEPNPCGESDPRKESSTGIHIECSPSLSICPIDSECRLEGERRGLCCPSNGTINEKTKNVDGEMLDQSLLPNSVLTSLLSSAKGSSRCPHGEPLNGEKTDGHLRCTPDDGLCPSTHYCLASNRSPGVCCPEKNYVCKMHVDEGSCSKNVNRFHFNPLLRECRPFVFGGCEGNMNNFESELQCQRFCHGVGPIEVMSASMHDDHSFHGPQQSFQIQFSLSGQKIEDNERMRRALRSFLVRIFSLDPSDIRDLSIKEEDNSVRFLLQSHDAVIKTDRMAKEIVSGKVSFDEGSSSYRVDPHSFSSKQLAMNRPKSVGTTNGGKLLYWGLMFVSILIVLLVFTSIICICAYWCFRREAGVTPCAFRGTPSIDVSSSGSDRGREGTTERQRPHQALLISHPTAIHRVPNKGLPRHNSTLSLDRE
ncbi:hypothetical protein PFISCL1PPCAC_15062, partial [Pristionchus fissidentatus]